MHNNKQHASPYHEVATDVKQMPIRPIIIIIIFMHQLTQLPHPFTDNIHKKTECCVTMHKPFMCQTIVLKKHEYVQIMFTAKLFPEPR